MTRSADKMALRKAWTDGDLAEVMRIAKELIARDPDDVEALLKLANVLSVPDPKYCDYPTAITIVTDAQNKHPDNRELALGTADVLKSCGEYGDAEKLFRELLQVNPDDCDALCGVASLEGHPGTSVTSKEAEELLEHAVRNCPLDWRVLASQAQFYNFKGNIERAKELYEHAIANLRPDSTKERKSLEQELRLMLQRPPR